MKFVPFTFEDHGEWVKSLLSPIYCEDTKGIVAEKDGEPVGVMLCDMWTHNSVQVHIGITDKMCLKHKMHYEFCDWVFNVCDRQMMLGLVPSNNLQALKLDKHFGFKEVGRIPNAIKDGVDYVIMQLTKDECKYISHTEEAA